jgi:Tol biopolymer transport system component
MRMTLFKALAACWLILAGPVSAEVRLLTGDADNAIHNRDGQLRDVSPDGNLVLFISGPPVTGSTPGITRGGLYLRNLSANTLTFVGVPVGGESNNNPTDAVEATMSDNGRYLTWSSTGSKIFWRDHQAGVTRAITPTADGQCRRPLISADGRYVVYVSVARNLIANTALLPASGKAGLYLYDSQTETTTIVSLRHNGTALTTGVGTTGPTVEYDFSANGNYVFFGTDSAGVHQDHASPGYWVYRRNLTTGAIDIANRNASGTVSTGTFTSPRCDATGNRVIFAGSLVGFPSGPHMMPDFTQPFISYDIFLKDFTTSEVWRISKTTDNSGNDGVFAAGGLALSDNGTVAAFASNGTKFVSGTTDPAGSVTSDAVDVFRVDVGSAGAVTTTLVSTAGVGNENVGFFNGPFIAGNGSYVAFETYNIFPLFGSGPVSSIYKQSFGVGTFPATGPNFTSWAAALPAGDRDLLDIPQNDGITNLQKFIHGIDPLSSSKANLPASGKATGNDLGLDGDSNTYLTVSFAVLKDLPPGFSWNVWAATTLEDLSNNPTPAQIVGSPEESGDTDVYIFRTPFTVGGGNNAGFLKVVVYGE